MLKWINWYIQSFISLMRSAFNLPLWVVFGVPPCLSGVIKVAAGQLGIILNGGKRKIRETDHFNLFKKASCTYSVILFFIFFPTAHFPTHRCTRKENHTQCEHEKQEHDTIFTLFKRRKECAFENRKRERWGKKKNNNNSKKMQHTLMVALVTKVSCSECFPNLKSRKIRANLQSGEVVEDWCAISIVSFVLKTSPQKNKKQKKTLTFENVTRKHLPNNANQAQSTDGNTWSGSLVEWKKEE